MRERCCRLKTSAVSGLVVEGLTLTSLAQLGKGAGMTTMVQVHSPATQAPSPQ